MILEEPSLILHSYITVFIYDQGQKLRKLSFIESENFIAYPTGSRRVEIPAMTYKKVR